MTFEFYGVRRTMELEKIVNEGNIQSGESKCHNEIKTQETYF